jgi:2-desacetyl-2-hydroxyethyl bacteriochlorophyllide A dehydrogenase
MVESQYWVWTAKETAEMRHETLGAPGPDQVLVKTRFTGISPGTEMALYMMTHVGFPDPANKYAKYPHRGGYLNVGVVAAAGANAAASHPVGTWVFSGAGHAQYALLSTPATGVGGGGTSGGGGPAACVLGAPLHGPEAAFAGMVRIAYSSVFMAPPALRETVAVFGGGLVGNFAAQLYRAAGAEVVLVEQNDMRRSIAEKCGLAVLKDLAELPARFPGGPRLVVEATGVPQLSVEAMKAAAGRGRVVILSSPRGEAPVNFYNQIHAKLLTVIGAHVRCLNETPGAQKLVIGLAEEGTVKLKPCLTHMEPWREAPRVWNEYARGAAGRLGTVLDWEK